ncbi:MAG: hypothetical protein JW929_06490 [Anaerolineales bacterium]|nr:hypothetical protein [Anaerolineales bacterium]
MQPVMRTDEHHFEKHKQFLALRNKQDVRLVFLGDSLTRRWEDNPGLWNKYFAAYHAANFGVGMDCLENIKWRVMNGELDGINPKAVVFLGGTNNLDKDSEEAIVEGIREIVEIVRRKLNRATIVLLGLFPRKPDEKGIDYPAKIDRINRRLDSLYAGTDVVYRDLGPDLLDEDGAVNETIMPDGLHLNAEGYDFIGPKLRAIIEAVW